LTKISRNIAKALSFPVTPILAALYPFLYFCSANIVQIKKTDITRSLIVVILGSIIVLLIFRIITRNWIKSAIISAWVVTLFFLYGQLYQWMRPGHIFLARHSILLPLFLLSMVALSWLVWKSSRDLSNLVIYSNTILLILVLISAFPVVRGLLHYAEINKVNNHKPSLIEDASQVSTPDVYLIIMDGYARDDVLEDYFHFDNSEFLNNLDSLGFVTLPCSRSNYRWTIQSISSMLNFNYNNDIEGDYTKNKYSAEELRNLISNSLMRSELEERGYRTVAFETGYPFSDLLNADKYYPSKNINDTLNNFENTFLNTTMLSSYRSVATRLGMSIQERNDNQDEYEGSPEYFYNIKISGFDNLDKVSENPSPKFVFAHLISTHRPYNMDEFGNFIGAKKLSIKSYTQQVIFTNKRVLKAIKKIIEESKKPPIIVLLSDHGIRINMEDGVKNFIAVYGSPEVTDNLYSSITPINVIRVIFSNIFGENLPLINDLSFNQEESQIDTYDLIQNNCKRDLK